MRRPARRCCICGAEQGVGDAAFVPLAADGRRADAAQRPELSAGTVEYVAPADYTVRPPMPPCYFFVLDVGQNAAASGGLATACAAIAGALDALAERNSSTKVGFLTYDSAVHFYNLSGGKAQMMVVPDIDDPFPPLPDEHYVTLESARAAIDGLLAALPSAFVHSNDLDSAMGAALQARRSLCSLRSHVVSHHLLLASGGSNRKLLLATVPEIKQQLIHCLSVSTTQMLAHFARRSACRNVDLNAQAAYRTISHIGGKLLLFSASASTLGAVKTKNRETSASYGTEREPALRQPADGFFRSFAAECINAQISIDVFSLAGQYCDLFSLSLLPRATGGSLYFYPAFNAARDGAKLTAELRHDLQRYTGWEAVMRMRCSKGMRVSTFHGHLHVRANDLVVLPTVDADSTYVAQLQMEDNLITEDSVYVQCALLYTSPGSERRIRVHPMRLPVVGSAVQLFEHPDAVGCAATLAKLGVDKARPLALSLL
jgi:Sec23/Sec24 trunk domain/Sec23/Sec24 beta-sandwich domain